jgi:nitroreductase
MPSTLTDLLPKIVEVAHLAPSVHNTQPWKVGIQDDNIIITIDSRHALVDGDQTGRETTISLGIFAEALSIGAALQGYTVLSVTSVTRGSVLVRLAPTNSDTTTAVHAGELLKLRHSDRSIYKPAIISDMTKGAIAAATRPFAVSTVVITDPKILDVIADLTSKGISLAMSSPAFRHELSNYLVTPSSHKQRGIATKSLYLNSVLTQFEPFFLRHGIGLGAETKLEKKRWQSASAVVAILADGDLTKYWLEVGRAYLRASLAITEAGLSQATSAAIVEASNYHDDIEELLGTKQRVLSLMRIGQGSPKHFYSPRVSSEELLKVTSS